MVKVTVVQVIEMVTMLDRSVSTVGLMHMVLVLALMVGHRNSFRKMGRGG